MGIDPASALRGKLPVQLFVIWQHNVHQFAALFADQMVVAVRAHVKLVGARKAHLFNLAGLPQQLEIAVNRSAADARVDLPCFQIHLVRADMPAVLAHYLQNKLPLLCIPAFQNAFLLHKVKLL